MAAPAPHAGRSPASLEALFALAIGGLHGVPFVRTEFWPLQFGLLALLVWRLGRASVLRGALIGGCFGTAWVAGGTWWLFISMHRYGGLPAPLAAAAVVLLAAALSLYLAAACAAYVGWRRGRPPLVDAGLFASVWLLAELARGVIFTGFPWVASGYAQVDAPLAALAPWVGVYGIGAAVAFVSALLAASARPGPPARRAGAAIVALALVGAAVLAPVVDFTRPTGTLQVTLLQTNVPQDEKFSVDRRPATLAWLSEHLLSAKGELVVAPETAIPVLPGQLGEEWWAPLHRHFRTGERAALIGLPLGSYEQGYTNSVAGLSSESALAPGGFYRYDKYHLVPFGEFIPTGFRWFTELMNIPLGDFSRGPLVAPSFAVRGAGGNVERVAPNICYEDLFGEDLAARFRDPDAAPTVFANLSNIGWFGNTIAIDQHLHISRLRAIEFQRPMLRATNTGATVMIDHTGRVTHEMAPFSRGVLDGPVQGREGLTPFARWASAAGLWPLLLSALAMVALAAAWPRRAHP